MKVVTTDQMRQIDQTTIEERGIPGSVLMDRAGKAVTREILERFEPVSAAIVAGKGNNAGDGFVVARELHRHGVRTTLFLLTDPEDLGGDALDAYRQVPETVEQVLQPIPQALREQLIQYDLIVDAIFGTGIKGPVRPPYDEYIQAINSCRMIVVSVDIPSGLSGDRITDPKDELGEHIRATLTVTIGLPKLGMILDPGVRFTGTVVVADIGFPSDLLNDRSVQTNLLTMADMRRILPHRPPGGHKGTFGRLLVVAGSEGMTGAAIMTAQAAMRSGVGLVNMAYPAPLGSIIEQHVIEAVKHPLGGDARWFTPEHVEGVLEAAENVQAVAIGPGFGRREATRMFLKEVLGSLDAPVVVDADGLRLIAEDPSMLADRPGPTVLTPHPGEAAALLGTTISEVQENRLEAFVQMCGRYGCVVALKGAQTVITGPDGQRYINPTGNTGLAKGGSGDVLTGLIGSLLAQGSTPLRAARLGVFLHGMTADQLVSRFGVRAMIPSDLIENLGQSFLELERVAP